MMVINKSSQIWPSLLRLPRPFRISLYQLFPELLERKRSNQRWRKRRRTLPRQTDGHWNHYHLHALLSDFVCLCAFYACLVGWLVGWMDRKLDFSLSLDQRPPRPMEEGSWFSLWPSLLLPALSFFLSLSLCLSVYLPFFFPFLHTMGRNQQVVSTIINQMFLLATNSNVYRWLISNLEINSDAIEAKPQMNIFNWSWDLWNQLQEIYWTNRTPLKSLRPSLISESSQEKRLQFCHWLTTPRE